MRSGFGEGLYTEAMAFVPPSLTAPLESTFLPQAGQPPLSRRQPLSVLRVKGVGPGRSSKMDRPRASHTHSSDQGSPETTWLMKLWRSARRAKTSGPKIDHIDGEFSVVLPVASNVDKKTALL